MMTSEPTNQNRIQLQLSLGDFPVPTSAQQEKGLGLQKKRGRDFFTNSCESYAWFDQNTSSWRTWQRSLITEWELYSESFARQGMMRAGQLFEQVIMSEPVTTETDGGSLRQTETLPTPLASVKDRKSKFAQGGTPLLGALLPTPTTMDHLPQRSPEALKKQMEGPRKGRTKLGNLREAVNPQTQELFQSMLPTPRASLGMKMKLSENLANLKHKKYLETEIAAKIHHSGEIQNTDSTQIGESMVLNPQFVELMMGLPLDYSQIEQNDSNY